MWAPFFLAVGPVMAPTAGFSINIDTGTGRNFKAAFHPISEALAENLRIDQGEKPSKGIVGHNPNGQIKNALAKGTLGPG